MNSHFKDRIIQRINAILRDEQQAQGAYDMYGEQDCMKALDAYDRKKKSGFKPDALGIVPKQVPSYFLKILENLAEKRDMANNSGSGKSNNWVSILYEQETAWQKLREDRKRMRYLTDVAKTLSKNEYKSCQQQARLHLSFIHGKLEFHVSPEKTKEENQADYAKFVDNLYAVCVLLVIEQGVEQNLYKHEKEEDAYPGL